MTYYFAYGANLNRREMKTHCPDSQPRFTATLPNYRLIFTGWARQWRGGVATIKYSRGDKVLGGVYEVSDRDLRKLDSDEGYPGTSNRIKVNVFDEDGTAHEALTYVRTGQLEETVASPAYLALMQQGYRDWGMAPYLAKSPPGGR